MPRRRNTERSSRNLEQTRPRGAPRPPVTTTARLGRFECSVARLSEPAQGREPLAQGRTVRGTRAPVEPAAIRAFYDPHPRAIASRTAPHLESGFGLSCAGDRDFTLRPASPRQTESSKLHHHGVGASAKPVTLIVRWLQRPRRFPCLLLPHRARQLKDADVEALRGSRLVLENASSPPAPSSSSASGAGRDDSGLSAVILSRPAQDPVPARATSCADVACEARHESPHLHRGRRSCRGFSRRPGRRSSFSG